MSEVYVSAAQLAERYGVSHSAIWGWARKGILPAPIRIGPSVTRWALSEIEARDLAARETPAKKMPPGVRQPQGRRKAAAVQAV